MPKILLVEDEPMISEPLGIVLETESFSVDFASNGLEALDCVNKNKYDLILLDLMMPVCSGVEFLQKASMGSRSPKTKIILMTNLSGGQEVEKAQALGVEQILLKAEITPKSLVELVQRECGLDRAPKA